MAKRIVPAAMLRLPCQGPCEEPKGLAARTGRHNYMGPDLIPLDDS
jgi:hypothetical protein